MPDELCPCPFCRGTDHVTDHATALCDPETDPVNAAEVTLYTLTLAEGRKGSTVPAFRSRSRLPSSTRGLQ